MNLNNDAMDPTAEFEAQRAQLLRLATRILGDPAEAEDIVQAAWLRLDRSGAERIENLPAWLTTVVGRLCLDRLRTRHDIPTEDVPAPGSAPDPVDDVTLAESVGIALQVVLDRLPPRERVAFVLHDSFGFEFTVIAAVLGSSPAAARKLASRARARLAQPASADTLDDWEIVDAFLAAARGGDFERLIRLLAPDADVRADDAAVHLGTPARIDGRRQVAEFFNGAARAAFPMMVGDRPGAAWIHRGETKVVFDFTIRGGAITRITFRAATDVLAGAARRSGPDRRD